MSMPVLVGCSSITAKLTQGGRKSLSGRRWHTRLAYKHASLRSVSHAGAGRFLLIRRLSNERPLCCRAESLKPGVNSTDVNSLAPLPSVDVGKGARVRASTTSRSRQREVGGRLQCRLWNVCCASWQPQRLVQVLAWPAMRRRLQPLAEDSLSPRRGAEAVTSWELRCRALQPRALSHLLRDRI
jgi:hypothetical protein